jgi:hypothetical protein
LEKIITHNKDELNGGPDPKNERTVGWQIMMTDTISVGNTKVPGWRLLGEFAATNRAALRENVTEAIKEFKVQPAQLVRIYEVLDQTLDRAGRHAAVDASSAPVHIRVLASVELAAGQDCGLFLVARQENKSVSGIEEITEVVDLFINEVRSTHT